MSGGELVLLLTLSGGGGLCGLVGLRLLARVRDFEAFVGSLLAGEPSARAGSEFVGLREEWLQAKSHSERVLILNEIIEHLSFLRGQSLVLPRSLGRIGLMSGVGSAVFVLAWGLRSESPSFIPASLAVGIGLLVLVGCSGLRRKLLEASRRAEAHVAKLRSVVLTRAEPRGA